MIFRQLRAVLGPLMLSVFIVHPACAQNQEDPYVQPDGSWIVLSGTVESVGADYFLLDYGDGTITVEMDDGDRDADAALLAVGDKVRVSGRVDDDFLEATRIEAASIYVENLGTTFYASSLDEEGTYLEVWAPVVLVGDLVLRGIVTSVTDEEFTLDTGLRQITVTVEEMPYDPLDDEGYQKIGVGDDVSVYGHVDRELFEGRVLVSEGIIKHYDY